MSVFPVYVYLFKAQWLLYIAHHFNI